MLFFSSDSRFSVCAAIYRRELADYFFTPVAYVFLVIFLAFSGAVTFYVGEFFERGQADLASFFEFHPWLYLIFAPALGMRLWSEERKTGTLQLLLTLPISIGEAVIAKFLASWTFIAVALLMTSPIWITVNYLGQPDNGVILASYIGSWIMAGAFLAISSCMSAFSQNQVITFVLAIIVSMIFMFGGLSTIQVILAEWLPHVILQTLASMNFIYRFESIMKGVVSLSSAVFFLSTAILFLYFTVVVVQVRKNA